MWVGDKGLDVFDIRRPRRCSEGKGGSAEIWRILRATKKKHIMAALKFSERRQRDHVESLDSFVTDLKILVKDCGYQEEECMVRDTIVSRCKHAKVREKCLDLADSWTCEKAVEIGQNHETNLSSLKKLTHDEDPKVNALSECQCSNKSKKQMRTVWLWQEPQGMSRNGTAVQIL